MISYGPSRAPGARAKLLRGLYGRGGSADGIAPDQRRSGFHPWSSPWKYPCRLLVRQLTCPSFRTLHNARSASTFPVVVSFLWNLRLVTTTPWNTFNAPPGSGQAIVECDRLREHFDERARRYKRQYERYTYMNLGFSGAVTVVAALRGYPETRTGQRGRFLSPAESQRSVRR